MKALYLIGIFLTTSIAQSHPIDIALVKMTPQNKVEVAVEMELNPAFGEKLLGHEIKSRTLSRDESTKLFSETLDKSYISRGSEMCHWQYNSLKSELLNEQTLSTKILLTCTRKGAFKANFEFLKSQPATFRLIVQLKGSGIEQMLSVNSNDRVAILKESENHSLKDFIAMGIAHIGATPSEWKDENSLKVPEGIDHVLFVVALLLASATLLDIFKVVTGFTLGHSITLALGALNLLHVPSQYVESAIALSIALVAVESLFLKKIKKRWVLAFLFGIVHGMGFATALTELQLSAKDLVFALVGFNIGVEAGQAIIIGVVFPLLWLSRNSKIYTFAFKPVMTASIFIVGTYWFFERVTGG